MATVAKKHGKNSNEKTTDEIKSSQNVDTNQQVINSAVKGVSYLFGLSALQKIVTFCLNMMVMREGRIEDVGAASVEMELVLSTILFLSREGFRLALLRSEGIEAYRRSSPKGRHQLQKIINMAWLPVPIGILIAMVVTYFASFRTNDSEIPNYSTSVVLYCVAAAIELMSEPMFILAQSSLYFGLRASAEGAAFLIKAMVQFISIHYIQLGLLSYGASQIAYAVTLSLIYIVYFVRNIKNDSSFPIRSIRHLFPGRIESKDSNTSWCDDSLLKLSLAMTLQSLIKHLLTEGDKIVLSRLGTYYDMGVYASAVNIGSLAPRLVFLPIEEASRAFFSKCLLKAHITDVSKPEDLKKKQEAYRFFTLVMKIVLYIGLIFLCFGTSYTQTLCFLLLGKAKSLTAAPLVLSWYCLYVVVLGINGICEAFVFSMADKHQVMIMNCWMVVIFVVYAVSAVSFMAVLRLGSVGLILANCINMSCRIIYCLIFIYTFFSSPPKTPFSSISIVPAAAVIQCLIVATPVMIVSKMFCMQHGTLAAHTFHVSVGGILFVVFIALVYAKERQFWRRAYQELKGEKYNKTT